MRRKSPVDIFRTSVREYREELRSNSYARELDSRYRHTRKPLTYIKTPLSNQTVIRKIEWPVEKPSFMNLLKPKLGIRNTLKRVARSAGGSFTSQDQRSRPQRRTGTAGVYEPLWLSISNAAHVNSQA
jgi:hypothetical protein